MPALAPPSADASARAIRPALLQGSRICTALARSRIFASPCYPTTSNAQPGLARGSCVIVRHAAQRSRTQAPSRATRYPAGQPGRQRAGNLQAQAGYCSARDTQATWAGDTQAGNSTPSRRNPAGLRDTQAAYTGRATRHSPTPSTRHPGGQPPSPLSRRHPGPTVTQAGNLLASTRHPGAIPGGRHPAGARQKPGDTPLRLRQASERISSKPRHPGTEAAPT